MLDMNRPDTAGRTLTEIMKENYGEQMGQWMTNYVSDMNNFNLDELCGMWKDQLKDSKKFMDVAYWAQSVKNKRKNPATGKHSPTYNQPGDNLIHRQNYINWLSSVINPPKAVTPAKSAQQPAAQGQGTKKAQQGQGKQGGKQTTTNNSGGSQAKKEKKGSGTDDF